MKTKNFSKIILLLILFMAIFFFTAKASLAENCRYACYASCPSGTSAISGDCNSGYTCCYDTGTATTSTAASATTSSSTTSSSFGNPLGSNTTIEIILSSIMSYLKGIAGTIAVIFIIIGGVMYMLSAGDKDMAERAKKTLLYAMAGLAIVVAAPTFYSEIVSVLGGSSSSFTSTSLSATSLKTIASNVLKLLLSIAGFIAIIMMIVGAIQMFTAAGQEDQYELGKKTVIYSIVGIIVVAASLVIATQIKVLIGG